ncbi:MAG: Hpt domain-containing protein, partial [Pseudomonadota bacterium]
MPEAFDTGPLSWVKDEIDQSLNQVLASFNAVNEAPEEFASLRFTIAHLYQVSGALDMVGLEGCKRYCSEIEKLTNKLEKQLIPISEAVMAHLIHAVNTLSQYLQDLLNGAPDTPTRLYASLKPLVDLQGEPLEESDLFYPDTTNSAPKDLPSNPMEESTLPSFIAEQRSAFQKALLDWLRTKDVDALNKMRTALLNVQQVQQKNAQRTLWWAATAFADALAQDKISAINGAKKLCRRLDHQLRMMSEGEVKAPSQLLRDVLYYVALSSRNTAVIGSVKDVFELDHVLPGISGEEGLLETDAERAALARLIADLPIFKDLWTSISEGSVDNRQANLVLLNAQLDSLTAVLESLSNQQVIHLFNTLKATTQALQAGNISINELTFIEVAAALNLFEFIGEHYQQLDIEAQHKISTQTTRLQSILDGVPLASALDAFATDKLDANVVSAVAKQIISALQLVEKALDTFFRNPESFVVLDEVSKPLEQVAAAFEMLEMPTPKAITQLSTQYVTYFRNNPSQPDDLNFELVAESLSMLGLFAEELPHIRMESEAALSDALQRLVQGAQTLGLVASENEAERNQANDTEQVISALPDAETVLVEPITTEHISNALTVDEVTDKAIDAELQDIFLTEAEGVLASLAQHLQALRVNATDSESLAEVRRAYHTLKGSGRTVGLTGMGEVAWAVEKLLNLVMERKAFPTPAMLAFIEKVSAEFANWVSELQANQIVTLNPGKFQKQAAELELDFERSLVVNKPAPQKEEVLIGGTRKLSKAFFNIFLAEAQQHLAVLVEAQKAITAGSTDYPTDESRRAAHTLGSNALTAGFKPIGDLARALEHWLDAHTCAWVEQHLALYGNVVKALADGLEKAKALKNPKSTRALILALSESTAAIQAAATQQAEADVLEAQMAELPTKKSKSKTKAKKAASVDNLPQELDAIANVIDLPETLNLEVNIEAETLESLAVESVNTAPTRDISVDQELLGLFLEEARELVPQLGKDLRGWRANPQDVEYADSLQRALHTLKGSARMAGQSDIGDSVHHMEDLVIHALRHKITADDFDELFVEFDRIGYMLEAISGGTDVGKQNLASLEKVITPTRSVARKSQFLRMPADVLDRLINEAGEVSITRSRMEREMQNFKQSSTDLTDSVSRLRAYLREIEIEAETQLQSRMSLLQEAHETFDPLEFDRFTRLQELTRMMAESVNDVATIQHGLLLNLDQTNAALQQQNRMNRELQQGLMGVRMLPFSTIVERLQRIVRQTARELDKRVEMSIDGETVELDRSVLDKIGAPLEHLLRNAVAHGLESTEERIKQGKSEVGQIKLKVSLDNDEIKLEIADDGSGINLNKVKQTAIEKGFFSPDQEITDQALMTVIFEPGFSTADAVSQIAGRGVGLDAVRSDIAALSGRIDVSNVQGTGAMFNIYLPVTLSVAQVVMVRAGNKVFAIPSVMVEQVQKLKQDRLISAYAAHKVDWADREYP